MKEENELTNFRYNLRLLRTSVQMSGEEFANALQMPLKRINDLEEGRLPPKFDDLSKITAYFDITYNELLLTKAKVKFIL